MIAAHNLSLKKSNRPVLSDISIELKKGEMVGLIGPNGSGKSSLMRSILRFEPDATGICQLWDKTPRQRAKEIAWLAQDRQVAWDMSVKEIILIGRTHLRSWNRRNSEDLKTVENVIEALDLQNFKNRHFQNLSGGEKARVLIARVLAQETPYIFADEPIESLDPAQQIKVLSILKKLANENKGILFSIHDLGLAARFCTRLILIDNGQIIAEGSVNEVLNDENLKNIFNIKVFRAESSGPILQPIEIVEN